MPVDINGTTGVTTPALASAAMPTSGGDPVVESGSNSDGEWTKWADGTQQCRLRRDVTVSSGEWSTLNSNLMFLPLATWSFPLTFTDTPSVSVSMNQFAWTRSTADFSPTLVRFHAVRETAASYSPLELAYVASGRWK